MVRSSTVPPKSNVGLHACTTLCPNSHACLHAQRQQRPFIQGTRPLHLLVSQTSTLTDQVASGSRSEALQTCKIVTTASRDEQPPVARVFLTPDRPGRQPGPDAITDIETCKYQLNILERSTFALAHRLGRAHFLQHPFQKPIVIPITIACRSRLS